MERPTPNNVKVRGEVLKSLSVDGHVVDDFADGELLARVIGKDKGFAVDSGHDGCTELRVQSTKVPF